MIASCIIDSITYSSEKRHDQHRRNDGRGAEGCCVFDGSEEIDVDDGDGKEDVSALIATQRRVHV